MARRERRHAARSTGRSGSRLHRRRSDEKRYRNRVVNSGRSSTVGGHGPPVRRGVPVSPDSSRMIRPVELDEAGCRRSGSSLSDSGSSVSGDGTTGRRVPETAGAAGLDPRCLFRMTGRRVAFQDPVSSVVEDPVSRRVKGFLPAWGLSTCVIVGVTWIRRAPSHPRSNDWRWVVRYGLDPRQSCSGRRGFSTRTGDGRRATVRGFYCR